MAQDTGKFRINTKDQYYTKSSIAKECVDCIVRFFPVTSEYEWIEPSAGNGSFLKVLPSHFSKIGIDLDPKMDGIIKGDFLTWTPTMERKRVFFGNPPFGRQGSLAKSFIQHASTMAEIIAFILPRSFMKPSMSRAFPLMFHCVFEKELPKNSFEVNSVVYDVPCIFQIWEKKKNNRQVEASIKEIGFKYVNGSDPYDLAFRRVGGKAGTCYLNGSEKFSIQSHYFLKLDDTSKIQFVLEKINAHIFPSNTVGPRSLSKGEVNEVINTIISSIYDE